MLLQRYNLPYYPPTGKLFDDMLPLTSSVARRSKAPERSYTHFTLSSPSGAWKKGEERDVKEEKNQEIDILTLLPPAGTNVEFAGGSISYQPTSARSDGCRVDSRGGPSTSSTACSSMPLLGDNLVAYRRYLTACEAASAPRIGSHADRFQSQLTSTELKIETGAEFHRSLTPIEYESLLPGTKMAIQRELLSPTAPDSLNYDDIMNLIGLLDDGAGGPMAVNGASEVEGCVPRCKTPKTESQPLQAAVDSSDGSIAVKSPAAPVQDSNTTRSQGSVKKEPAPPLSHSSECRSTEGQKEILPTKGRSRRKKCAVEDCIRRARSWGFCKAHSEVTKCSVQGCERQSQGNKLCIKHGGGKRCEVEGCPKAAQSKGKCKSHGGGVRCQVEGCTRSSQGGGRCRTHGGGPRCHFPGCTKSASRFRLCNEHCDQISD